MSRRQQPEAQLQRAVLDHLAWRGMPGVFAFHPANGGWRSAIEAAILKSMGVVPGVPDLIVIHCGQVYGLELKSDRGRLSAAQVTAHVAMRRAGAHVAVAYDIDAAITQLAAWGLLRGGER